MSAPRRRDGPRGATPALRRHRQRPPHGPERQSCASTPRMGPTTAPRLTRSATPHLGGNRDQAAGIPARGAPVLADVGKVTTSTWVEYSLSPVTVTANGLYSFVLVAQSTDGVHFNSRENTTNPPQLVLTPPIHHRRTTTAPSAPVLTLTETAPEAHVAGIAPLLQPGCRVLQQRLDRRRPRLSDAESGIAQVASPADRE